MSLIYFHIALILTAIVFSFSLGIWGIEHFVNSRALLDLLTGAGSFLAAFGFAAYLAWFIKKNKKRWKNP